ncbi:MAG: Polyprenyl synthetase family protein [Patescibacteria group bacterium]|nr:Polyprenyl synthetase family protein [Patescibacteria group bacterium]
MEDDKTIIDTDISLYVDYLKTSTKEQYSDGSQLALDAYCSILTRGGKRLRGALVMEGYKMCGGTNQAMILQAARAIEMIHAYLLVIDDIQDRSLTRRGGPTAHVMLQKVFKDKHLAETMATNGALLGCHAAMMILANLDAPAELRNNVLSITNRTLLVTVHGQIADPLLKESPAVTENDILAMQDWKTATYTFLNPLHVGMVLAGADCHATDGITPYAHALGQAFQITDDIIGTFGDAAKTGKGTMDDIREGKQTLLVHYTLKHGSSKDAQFLRQQLGNPKLTKVSFTKCQQIIETSGALAYAKQQARYYAEQAIASLPAENSLWSKEGAKFLHDMALFVQERSA